jgi:hypothetical protein
MKKISFLLLAALSIAAVAHAQKVTKDVRPDTHESWLVTDDVDLNFRLIQSGPIFAHLRAEGPTILLYLSGSGQLSPRDYAYFVTDQDTVVVHSTGAQPGGWNGNNPYHEYSMTRDELVYLSQHPIKLVLVSHYGGWQVTNIPAKDEKKLMPYCSAILSNL